MIDLSPEKHYPNRRVQADEKVAPSDTKEYLGVQSSTASPEPASAQPTLEQPKRQPDAQLLYQT